MTTEQIIVSTGVTVIAGIAIVVKIQLSLFFKKHSDIIQLVETKIKAEIGQSQYDTDVKAIKDTITALGVNKQAITMEIATAIINSVRTKVKFNDTEILDIIYKIAKSVL
jgi:hypothetical protein